MTLIGQFKESWLEEMLMKTKGAIKNGQRHWRHCEHKTQDEDKQNKTKTNYKKSQKTIKMSNMYPTKTGC